jgi:hypothetical protein
MTGVGLGNTARRHEAACARPAWRRGTARPIWGAASELRESYLSDVPRIHGESRNPSSMIRWEVRPQQLAFARRPALHHIFEAKMKDSMKLTVAERNTLLELAHLLNEGLGDIAVMLAEPWLQDAPRNAPRTTALVRRKAGLRALCNASGCRDGTQARDF